MSAVQVSVIAQASSLRVDCCGAVCARRLGAGIMRGMPTVRCLLPSFLLPVAAALSAATLQVTSTGDTVANDGACSLREAVSSANTKRRPAQRRVNAASGGRRPSTASSCRPAVTACSVAVRAEDNNVSGDLDIRRGGLAIVGAGADLTEIRGDRNQRVLDIGAGLPALAAIRCCSPA